MEAEFLTLFNAASKAADAAALDVIGGGDDESQCLDALRSLKAFPVTSQLLVTTQVTRIFFFHIFLWRSCRFDMRGSCSARTLPCMR